ncbi:MAG: hypothetical protein CMO68_06120 [Verrucomicrobiales bacterium]|nr:hypothetical protein [Verrucomicrobiales bacterium]
MAVTFDAPSTNWQTASEITSSPRVIYPIYQNTSAIIYERDMVQNEANWTPLALDTADATHSSAFLVEETTPQQIGGGLVRWTRRFATVPNNWHDYEERVFTFPGYYNDPYESNFRCPLTKNVTWRILHEYTKTTDPYADFDVSEQKFQVEDSDGCVLDYVDDSTTTPSYTTYTGYVSAGTMIDVAHQTLERYAGNIWVRRTYESKAQ